MADQETKRPVSYRPPHIYSIAAGAFTVLLILISFLCLFKLNESQLSAYGTFIGASATAITLCWMVAGFWLQRHVIQKQSLDQSLQRGILKQQVLVVVFDKYFIRLEEIAGRLNLALYPPMNSGVSYENQNSIDLLLKRPTLIRDLQEAYTSGTLMPLVHASSYLAVHDALTSSLHADAEIESHARSLRDLIYRTNASELARRITSAVDHLPKFGREGAWRH